MGKRITNEEAHVNVLRRCEEKNYELVEDFVFIGGHKTFLHLKCGECGNEWNSTNYDSFTSKNCGCPECAKRYKKSENKIGKYLKELELNYITQYSPNWMGRLRLDFYLPELNIGIEYQGIQHFKINEFFGGEKAFEGQLERDERKMRLCIENGIELLYFTFEKI